MILHALHALDSCSFHLCCSVLWLLNLEAFTYELGTRRVPGEAFEAVAGDRVGRAEANWLNLWHHGQKNTNLQLEFELRQRSSQNLPGPAEVWIKFG